MRLESKVAIITGAGSGIGKATALTFAKEGAKVVVADWAEENGKQTVEEIKQQNGDAIFVKTDVSKVSDVENMVKTCIEEFGRVDILYNNAGILKSSSLHEMSEKDWDQVIDVDLKSVFLGIKYVIPHMLKQGSGKIISTASVAGIVGFQNIGAYCAAKGAIITLTKEMAMEYAPKNINVNCIAPGLIRTAMTKGMLEDPETKKHLEESTLYTRFGEPQDIAYAALYLASEESNFVNGITLVVDGGWVAH